MKISSDYTYSNPSFCAYKETPLTRCVRFYNKTVHKGKFHECNFKLLDRLHIQDDLPTFEGLPAKDIAGALTDLCSLSMISGCIKHCLHCYVNAQAPIKRVTFETFKQLMDDISALKERLGFSPVYIRDSKYIVCGIDVDGMDWYLLDKEGNKHDAIEIARLMHKSSDYKVIWDTNGWDREDTEKQKIAENYVKELLKKQNYEHFRQINISLNPFNPKYVRALRNGYDPRTYSTVIPMDRRTDTVKKTPKEEKAEKDYRDYIKDEANLLFTFTPLLLEDKLTAIIRAMNKNVTNMEGFYIDEYSTTLSNILAALRMRYLHDLLGERKYIKNEQMLNKAMNKYESLLSHVSSWLVASGRIEKLYRVRHNGSLEGIEMMDKTRAESDNYYNKLVTEKKTSAVNVAYLKVIAPDGRVYLHDNYIYIPTSIKLNTGIEEIKNPFGIPTKDFVVTSDMMDMI